VGYVLQRVHERQDVCVGLTLHYFPVFFRKWGCWDQKAIAGLVRPTFADAMYSYHRETKRKTIAETTQANDATARVAS